MTQAPIHIFGADTSMTAPSVFFAAHRYVQGPGVLSRIGAYLPMLKSTKPAILLPGDLPESIKSTVEEGLALADIDVIVSRFGGQCSHEEIVSQVEALRQQRPDCLIAIGGGKVIDAAKCIAGRLEIPLIVCPTLASTDAPCSAAAVVYTADGVFKDVEYFSGNPDLVVVDTAVIARAPLRFLLAGMADALATGYEARTCVRNAKARSMVGGRITLAAATIAEICSKTIFEHANGAIAAAKRGVPDDSFEKVVEANTLLSGTGFESGGLAATHAVASALTVIPSIEHKFLHGEMVSVGLMVHLALEEDDAELDRVRALLLHLGLPTRFSDLGLNLPEDADTIRTVEEVACSMPFMANEPFAVSPECLRNAILALETESTPETSTAFA